MCGPLYGQQRPPADQTRQAPTGNQAYAIVRPNLLSAPKTLGRSANGRTAACHVGTRFLVYTVNEQEHVIVCLFDCSNNKDMKQLINLLNTTLQSQPKQARAGRPESASDRALSSVAAADDDNSDIAVVRPQVPRQNLGVTFVKASPTVITVPSNQQQQPTDDDDDGVCYGSEPRFQLGVFIIKPTFVIYCKCKKEPL